MQRLHAYPDIRAMFRRLLIATVTGVLAALAVAVFRHSMYLLEWLFLSNESGSLVNAAAALSPWRRALTPALGGLAAGVLLWGWQRMTAQRPHAPTDYMEALETGDGQFDYGASLVKSLASLLVVASGSAIGREGAMILLAALAASFFAQRCTPKSEWKLWIACGAAAGMASAYHAPLAGSLFIAEILFGTLMLASLGPVMIAAVVALLTTRLLSPGANTLYDVHLSEMLTAVDYFLIVGVGLLAGLCGPLLMWLMAFSHSLFLRLKLSPPWQLALLVLKTAISLVTGLVVWGMLAALDVRFAFVWGLLAFALNYIPNIGSVLAAIPPILQVLVFSGLYDALILLAGYLVINLVFGNILEPRIMGRGLGLSTLVVFLSLIFWGWLLGPVGMLLSVPLTIIVKIGLEQTAGGQSIAVLLSDMSHKAD